MVYPLRKFYISNSPFIRFTYREEFCKHRSYVKWGRCVKCKNDMHMWYFNKCSLLCYLMCQSCWHWQAGSTSTAWRTFCLFYLCIQVVFRSTKFLNSSPSLSCFLLSDECRLHFKLLPLLYTHHFLCERLLALTCLFGNEFVENLCGYGCMLSWFQLDSHLLHCIFSLLTSSW